jgi:hypothetical protein
MCRSLRNTSQVSHGVLGYRGASIRQVYLIFYTVIHIIIYMHCSCYITQPNIWGFICMYDILRHESG